jgi:hypothetical protein
MLVRGSEGVRGLTDIEEARKLANEVEGTIVRDTGDGDGDVRTKARNTIGVRKLFS